jgi:hypothetical protein
MPASFAIERDPVLQHAIERFRPRTADKYWGISSRFQSAPPPSTTRPPETWSRLAIFWPG